MDTTVITKTRKDRKPFRRLKDQKKNIEARQKYIEIKKTVLYFLRLLKRNVDVEKNFKLLQSSLSKSKILHINRKARLLSRAHRIIKQNNINN